MFSKLRASISATPSSSSPISGRGSSCAIVRSSTVSSGSSMSDTISALLRSYSSSLVCVSPYSSSISANSLSISITVSKFSGFCPDNSVASLMPSIYAFRSRLSSWYLLASLARSIAFASSSADSCSLCLCRSNSNA